MEQLLFVAETANDARLYERLARAGVPLAVLSPTMLSAERRDALYLITAERAASIQLDERITTDANICLIPPWPAPGLTLGKARLFTTPAEHRDPIQLDARLKLLLDSSARQEQLLSILYREQFVGLAGTSLGTSLSSETVLMALPRTSNLYGLRIITTLLVGQPSTLTNMDDTITLLQALSLWISSESGEITVTQKSGPIAGPLSSEIEHQAQLLLLAIALLLPERKGQLQQSIDVTIVQAQVYQIVEQLSQLLSMPTSAALFLQSWEVLSALGIISTDESSLNPDQAGVISLANVPRALEFLDYWQLGSRLRRLRTAYGATLQPGIGVQSEEGHPIDQTQAREG